MYPRKFGALSRLLARDYRLDSSQNHNGYGNFEQNSVVHRPANEFAGYQQYKKSAYADSCSFRCGIATSLCEK